MTLHLGCSDEECPSVLGERVDERLGELIRDREGSDSTRGKANIRARALSNSMCFLLHLGPSISSLFPSILTFHHGRQPVEVMEAVSSPVINAVECSRLQRLHLELANAKTRAKPCPWSLVV